MIGAGTPLRGSPCWSAPVDFCHSLTGLNHRIVGKTNQPMVKNAGSGDSELNTAVGGRRKSASEVALQPCPGGPVGAPESADPTEIGRALLDEGGEHLLRLGAHQPLTEGDAFRVNALLDSLHLAH